MNDIMQTTSDTPVTPVPAAPRPSAKTFREPLLKVLGSLNNYMADTTVVHTDVYPPVLALLGISEMDHGIAPGTQGPQTYRWVQLAFMALKEDGLALTPKKGQWGLTDLGVQTARSLAGLSQTGIVPAPVTMSPAPVTMSPAPVVAPSPVATPTPVSFLRKPAPSAYDTDAYLRSLAVAASNCIGYFSLKSETCQTCPLSPQCRNKQLADFSTLAAEFRKEDAAKVLAAARAAPAAVAAPAKAQSTPVVQTPTKGWSNNGIEKIVNHTETVCYRCSQTIPLKVQCYWKQDDGTGESGLFHLECK